ncbi:MAG: hypothetical protein RIS35_2068, partial [Pseudomonadota bacterium]
MAPPPPSAEAQLAFLTKLQRLYAEGEFAATYKFALMIALADLSVEFGRDDGGELTLPTRMIAQRFVELYWTQVPPYGSGSAGTVSDVLSQNYGDQAAVVRAVSEFRSETSTTSFQRARVHPCFSNLVTRVAATVSAQPLKFLQNFGGATDEFLFERHQRGSIRLKPGVAYCLRRFYPLVQQLSRTHWIDHIKSNRRNQAILGNSGDLEDFLFGASRQALTTVATILRKIDGDKCFYCGETLREADVDHYVPFSLYPRDLAHNFVLAHPPCNRSKSDTLAARVHLERWLERFA